MVSRFFQLVCVSFSLCASWCHFIHCREQGMSIRDDYEVKQGVTLGICKRLEGHKGKVTCVAFSPDNTSAATGSKDKTIRLWDAYTGEFLRELRRENNEGNSVTSALLR